MPSPPLTHTVEARTVTEGKTEGEEREWETEGIGEERGEGEKENTTLFED